VQKLKRFLLLTEFSNDIVLNEDLSNEKFSFMMIKRFVDINYRTSYFYDKKLKDFSRNGALLNEDDKLKLREIDTELAKIDVWRKCFWLKPIITNCILPMKKI
jgi:Zn-dependent oligopeptidase